MSWSYKIAILYSGFAGLILTLVIISSNNKEELVSKDYYARELVYQQHIDAMNNEKSLKESLNWKVDEHSVLLLLPEEFKTKKLSGEINFYCPATSSKDRKVTMHFRRMVHSVSTRRS